MLWPFLVIFWQLHKYFLQNLSADGHFRVLNLFGYQLDQKLQHKTHIFLYPLFFNCGRKNHENLCLRNGYFFTILGHFFANYMIIFHKTEVQTVILRCLVCLNLNWIKSYDIILVKVFFLCLKLHHFRASLPKETSSQIFKMAIFSKFFGAFMRHKIR